MVASRKVQKIVCCVVRVPDHPKQPQRYTLADSNRTRLNSPRPSDLLPWADPYITQLVRNLQHEVRSERSRPRCPTAAATSSMAMPLRHDSKITSAFQESHRGPLEPEIVWPVPSPRNPSLAGLARSRVSGVGRGEGDEGHHLR